MTEWSAIARDVIAKVHVSVPADAALADRMKAIDAAYPFGERSRWPYKAWLKARRDYLRPYGYAGGPSRTPHFSPLERLMIAAGRPPVVGEARRLNLEP